MSQPTRPLARFLAACGWQPGWLAGFRHDEPITALLLLVALPVLVGMAFIGTFLAAPLLLLIAAGEGVQNARAHRSHLLR